MPTRAHTSAVPARAHQLERPGNCRAYANSAVPHLTLRGPSDCQAGDAAAHAAHAPPSSLSVAPPLPTLVAGRAYVGLRKDRTHLETGGPDEDGGPYPAA